MTEQTNSLPADPAAQITHAIVVPEMPLNSRTFRRRCFSASVTVRFSFEMFDAGLADASLPYTVYGVGFPGGWVYTALLRVFTFSFVLSLYSFFVHVFQR